MLSRPREHNILLLKDQLENQRIVMQGATGRSIYELGYKLMFESYTSRAQDSKALYTEFYWDTNLTLLLLVLAAEDELAEFLTEEESA